MHKNDEIGFKITAYIIFSNSKYMQFKYKDQYSNQISASGTPLSEVKNT